jgi:hypothetical protein
VGILAWWRSFGRSADIEIPPIIPVEDMDEDDKESFREAAALEQQYALRLRDTVTEQMITSARWLQTSLLLLNAGAGAALLQSDHVEPHYRAWAGAAFVAGSLLALLQAYVGIHINLDAPVRLTRSAGYWLSVKVSLNRIAELERDQLQWAQEVKRRSRLPSAIGWASIVSFAIGCLIASQGILA